MAYLRLGHEARELIMCLLVSDPDVSWTEVGHQVGFHRSTIQREVARNGGRHTYSARRAQRRCREQASRGSGFRFDREPDLAAEVRRLLVAGYSPYAIAYMTGQVCTETIYQGIYSKRLGLESREVLRTRRPKRRHRRDKRPSSEGNYLGDFVPISERPIEIENRNSVGHWEGDLITGALNQSAVVTLVERHSRYECALELPNGHGTTAVIAALSEWLQTHQRPVVSLTWDRGAELTKWTHLVEGHGIDIYFCDPKSPWQRATAENQNRQLRFWLRKGSDLTVHNQNDLNRICHILNTTPRRLHNGATAQHIYQQQPRTKPGSTGLIGV